jgi:MFS transporter, MHS family, proline/betaine transporter
VIGAAMAVLVLPAYLAECFPVEVRATGLGLTFGLATAVVGGTAPLVAALLVGRGLAAATPGYLTVLAVVGLIAMVGTAPVTSQWAAGDRDGSPKLEPG